MRQKLVHAQKILEAVVTSDWTALETESRELERLTTEPAWTSLKLPEYAPKAYVAVTLTCVECHRYLARVRLAK